MLATIFSFMQIVVRSKYDRSIKVKQRAKISSTHFRCEMNLETHCSN